MRRGILPFLGALTAVAMWSGPANAGPDYLIGACQAAVGVHAKHVTLRFEEAARERDQVRLRFAFDNGGRRHGGMARCVFHRAASATAPPSLIELEMMGQLTPARFLISHHAVWRYFKGESEPVAKAAPKGTEPPAEQIEEGKRRRELAAH